MTRRGIATSAHADEGSSTLAQGKPYREFPALWEFVGSYAPLLEKELAALSIRFAPCLDDAYEHVVLSPGKRLRPLLCLLSAEAVGRDPAVALPAAAALELVHASSLVLDDLPSMDDARTRRGSACVHILFGEDVAILLAVALLTTAHELLIENYADPILAGRFLETVGPRGMCAGQLLDLRGSRHRDAIVLKTSNLLALSAECGARVAGAGPARVERLRCFGAELGTAFQLIDDFLDEEAVDDRDARELLDSAASTLDGLGSKDVTKLRELSAFIRKQVKRR